VWREASGAAGEGLAEAIAVCYARLRQSFGFVQGISAARQGAGPRAPEGRPTRSRTVSIFPFLRLLPSFSGLVDIRLQAIGLAHALILKEKERILDGAADEVGALAFGCGGNAVNGLESRLIEVDQHLGYYSYSIDSRSSILGLQLARSCAQDQLRKAVERFVKVDRWDGEGTGELLGQAGRTRV